MRKGLWILPGLLAASLAWAQVGVETGIMTGGNAGALEALRRLGQTVGRLATNAEQAIPGAVSRQTVSSGLAFSAGQRTGGFSFVPRVPGGYVAGLQFDTPNPAPVTLQVGGATVTGTALAPLLLPFRPQPGTLCRISATVDGELPGAGLHAQVQVVREAGPGEVPVKSLLTPEQRRAEFANRGPRPSVFPLAVNLAERHLAHVTAPTDLDGLFTTVLASIPGVTGADLSALIADYAALAPTVQAQCYAPTSRDLRKLATPTLADLPASLRPGTAREIPPPPAPGACHIRLSFTKLECADASNPEWWGSDRVVLLWNTVADDHRLTQTTGLLSGFDDGVSQPLTVAPESFAISQGLGVALNLWQWDTAASPASFAPWAIREALANALTAPEPRYTDPAPQDTVARELTVDAHVVGQLRLIWPRADLEKLLAPGKSLEQVLELRWGDRPEDYDATGWYRLTCVLERLD